jgi:hypothetical protein
MKKLIIVAALLPLLLLQGCAAVAIGAYAYDKSAKREVHQKYFEQFNNLNIEREKNGLKPLDLCTYKKSVDKEWASDDENCK